MTAPVIELQAVSKRFTLHHQHGAQLHVLQDVNLRVAPGECVVLDGPSGQGKSTLLKLIYANYLASGGRIVLTPPGGQALDLTQAEPRALVQMRRDSVGYVGQFLRVIHQSACKRFGTVLGPAYNAAHADHFHVEPGGGGFCRRVAAGRLVAPR